MSNLWERYEADIVLKGFTVCIEKPIVTLENLNEIGDVIICGIAYFRPEDEWNPIAGVKLALDSAIHRGNFDPKDKDAFWKEFEVHKNRILRHKPGLWDTRERQN